MEGSQRRSFTDHYKRQTVDLVASSGRARRPTTQAALPSADGRDRPFAARERAAALGARHFKKVDRDLCWSSEMRFRFIEDRRVDYPMTIRLGRR